MLDGEYWFARDCFNNMSNGLDRCWSNCNCAEMIADKPDKAVAQGFGIESRAASIANGFPSEDYSSCCTVI